MIAVVRFTLSKTSARQTAAARGPGWRRRCAALGARAGWGMLCLAVAAGVSRAGQWRPSAVDERRPAANSQAAAPCGPHVSCDRATAAASQAACQLVASAPLPTLPGWG
jgi:hypothetical protein